MVVSENVNSRIQEFEFLISIMNDLLYKYPNHNQKVLTSVVSQLEYQKSNEETTVIAKSQSETNNTIRKHRK